MTTNRCRYCGSLYLPERGAVRSYYCTRSCKEKAYRFKKKCDKNRAQFQLNCTDLHAFKKLVMSGKSPSVHDRTIRDIMQYIDPRAHKEVLRLLRRFHMEAYEGVELTW